jgi:hypothetical protein
MADNARKGIDDLASALEYNEYDDDDELEMLAQNVIADVDEYHLACEALAKAQAKA